MVKYAICGRTIRTGRKYCYEHRNVSSNTKIIAQIEKKYIKLYRDVSITVVILICIFLLLIRYSISSNYRSYLYLIVCILFLSLFF